MTKYSYEFFQFLFYTYLISKFSKRKKTLRIFGCHTRIFGVTELTVMCLKESTNS